MDVTTCLAVAFFTAIGGLLAQDGRAADLTQIG